MLAAVLPEFASLVLLDLDAEEDRSVAAIHATGGDPDGWEARWQRSLECLRGAEGHVRDFLVDVGAGALQTAEGRDFFAKRCFNDRGCGAQRGCASAASWTRRE